MIRRRSPVVGADDRPRPDAQAGLSLAELVVALAIGCVLIAFTVPTTAATIDAGRVNAAANAMASRFRLTRLDAVSRGRSTALVFDQVGPRWVFRICADGNGNGIRRSEIQSGTDTCADAIDLQAMFPGVQIDVDATLRGPSGEPPSPNPVRFGASNIASFSALGSCTAGTLFLRSPKGQQYAVRIAGATGRTRVLRYDSATVSWLEL
jgi:prepilin-type N-terminal cleavage/methylation domain-containing protein